MDLNGPTEKKISMPENSTFLRFKFRFKGCIELNRRSSINTILNEFWKKMEWWIFIHGPWIYVMTYAVELINRYASNLQLSKIHI